MAEPELLTRIGPLQRKGASAKFIKKAWFSSFSRPTRDLCTRTHLRYGINLLTVVKNAARDKRVAISQYLIQRSHPPKGFLVGKWTKRKARPRRHKGPAVRMPCRGDPGNENGGRVLWSVALAGGLLCGGMLCLGEEQPWTVRRKESARFGRGEYDTNL